MNFGLLHNTWNKIAYGWDLNTLNTDYSLFIDVSHWSTQKDQFSRDKFAQYVQTKNLKGLIFKISDANRSTGFQYYDILADFWYRIAMDFKLDTTGYHWLQPSVDPNVAWKFYYNFIKDHPPTLPYVVDWEEPSVSNASDYAWRLKTYLENSGSDTIIYTANWYVNKMKALLPSALWNQKLSWMKEYPLWCAWYSREFPTKNPNSQWPWTDFVGWQYSATADYPYYYDEDKFNGTEMGGTSSGLDMNWFRNDFLKKYSKNIDIPVEDPDPLEDPIPVEDDGYRKVSVGESHLALRNDNMVESAWMMSGCDVKLLGQSKKHVIKGKEYNFQKVNLEGWTAEDFLVRED